MYGYVRPLRDELKVREYETFRGVYCGLCHTLRRRYGPLYRYAVNYDLTFLSMLLAGCGEGKTCLRRCPYHPLRQTACPETFPALEAAADLTVILAWWKLRDGVMDDGFFKSLGCRLLSLVVRSGFQKAADRRPDFAAAVEENLRALSRMEAERCPGVDEPADRFGRILRAVGEEDEDPARRRILSELLYHLGRIVYILDAADDLEEDSRTGAYNPLRYRFELQDGRLSQEDEAELRNSLQLSHNSLSSAFALLEQNPYTDILSNIIYFGLPAVTQSVFSGNWRKTARQRKREDKL